MWFSGLVTGTGAGDQEEQRCFFILEGDGAFLWMMVILALVLLYVRR